MSEPEELRLARKQLATATAVFAIAGYSLLRRLGGGFRIERGAWSVDLDDWASVYQFARGIGVVLPELSRCSDL